MTGEWFTDILAHYNWQAPSSEVVYAFDSSGSHIYVTTAPDSRDTAWVEKVDLISGLQVWATQPADGWRFPLGDAGSRTIV